MKLHYELLVVILFRVLPGLVSSQNANTQVVLFDNEPSKCRMYTAFCVVRTALISSLNASDVEITSSNANVFKYANISVLENFTDYAIFGYDSSTNDTQWQNSYNFYAIKIVPVLVGRAYLKLRDNVTNTSIGQQQVTIIRPMRPIDIVYDVFLWVYCGIVSLLMGILFDKEIFFRIVAIPKEIALSFCCQYFLMPLVSYWIATAFQCSYLQILTFFIFGCSPGAMDSNSWATSFDGDFELSTILTLITTVAAVAMMPIWLYSFGYLLMLQTDFFLPVEGLFKNLAVLVLPCIFGIGFGILFPKSRKVFKIVNKIQSILLQILFIILVLVSRFYSTKFSKITTILPGPLTAFSGYFLGALLSWILRFPCKQIKTVAISTGLKNVILPILIVNTNFPSPDADFVLFCLVPAFFQSSIPLKLIGLVLRIRRCVAKRRDKKEKKQSALNEINMTKPTTENVEVLRI